MIVLPRIKGFICTTAHPIGCAENIKRQIAATKKQGIIENGPKKVLIIGASTGYGLASRITAAFGSNAATLGVMFEREAVGTRTATAGFYNTKAFEKEAKDADLYAKSINGDAFSQEIKNQVIDTIKEDLGQVDLVVYSLAAPRRTMADGTVYHSVLKTCGEPFTEKNWNVTTNEVSLATIPPATEDETLATIKVMGGEDWFDWMKQLKEAGVLAEGCTTVAYSYIGPVLTYPVYHDGTIGQAKENLFQFSNQMNEEIPGIHSYISVNKALVTQASSAIPIVPLYFSILYKVMKEKCIHEGCIEQMNRLFHTKLYGAGPVLDENGLIRMDDWEMKKEVQEEVSEIWAKVTTENLMELADVDGYNDDFRKMFGFNMDNVDYDAEVEV